MKTTLLAILLAIALSTGCAQMFTAKTVATYESPDGKKIAYESNKEQIGLEASWEEGNTRVHIKVDKSGTQESVVAATLLIQQKWLDLVDRLSQQAATKGMAGGAGTQGTLIPPLPGAGGLSPVPFATRP